ncbi:MAG: hypothetical protein L0387_23050 [Acidobacteria bacterium]|nr:hypothetical protein [Acidobacteriota bacterium]
MKRQFFGDSYDIVKRAFLDHLKPLGEWVVNPMFTDAVSEEEASNFSDFLGAVLLTNDVFTGKTNRSEYFASSHECGHLFLDPDTGLRIMATQSAKSPSYLFAAELVSISKARPNSLTLVFDQSLARGNERRQVQEKLTHLSQEGLHSLAYVSHACFILVGIDTSLMDKAQQAILQKSRLLANRLIKSGTGE